MPSFHHALRLGKDADFLPAPAQRRFGVDDVEFPGPVVSHRDGEKFKPE
jgi:hypothetical protein